MFPGITSSGLRLEQQRMKCASTYCLLGGAGTHFYKIIYNFSYWFPWFFLGTFYLLIVIACATLKTLIKTTNSGDILCITNNLRCPCFSLTWSSYPSSRPVFKSGKVDNSRWREQEACSWLSYHGSEWKLMTSLVDTLLICTIAGCRTIFFICIRLRCLVSSWTFGATRDIIPIVVVGDIHKLACKTAKFTLGSVFVDLVLLGDLRYMM